MGGRDEEGDGGPRSYSQKVSVMGPSVNIVALNRLGILTGEPEIVSDGWLEISLPVARIELEDGVFEARGSSSRREREKETLDEIGRTAVERLRALKEISDDMKVNHSQP